MQSQANFKASTSDTDCPGLGLPLPQKNHAQTQNFFTNEHFHYNPYSYYHPYWSYPHDYHFSHPYFNAHQNYWNQHYMNEQRKNDLQEFHHSHQPKTVKTQNPTVKLEPTEEVQEVQTVLELRSPKRKYKMLKKHRKNNASYYWSADENRRYSDFLSLNSHLYSLSLSQKKNLRVNVMMSKKVKTRTPQQCHSHHQKMMKKYGSITQIVEVMKRERHQYQKRIFQPIKPVHLQDQVLKDHIKEEPRTDL